MRSREFIIEYNREVTLRNRKIRDGLLQQYAVNMPGGKVNDAVFTYMADSVLNRMMTEIENVVIPGVPKNYFAPWLALWMSRGYFEANEWDQYSQNTSAWRFRGIIPLLEAYYKYKNKSWFPKEYKDIYKLSPIKLHEVITNLEVPEELVTDRGNTKVVLDNSEIRILHILDKAAAIYYGQGTNPRWCTSYTDSENKFDYYNSLGPLYVLLPKKPQHVGEKYQMHFHRFSSDEYTDEHNEFIGFNALIDRFGEEFKNWLLDLRPKYKESMMLEDEKTILKLWQGFGDYVYDRFKKEGEELVNDGLNYYSGDEDVMKWAKFSQKKMLEIWDTIQNTSIEQIRRIASENYDKDGSLWHITDVIVLWDELFDQYARESNLFKFKSTYKYFDLYDIIGGRPYIVKADEMDSNEVIKVRHVYDLERIGDYVILSLGGYRN
jgi:hypothetical protein